MEYQVLHKELGTEEIKKAKDVLQGAGYKHHDQ